MTHDLRTRPENPATPPGPLYNIIVVELECMALHARLGRVDHACIAHPREARCMQRSSRITRITRVARMIRNTVLPMALGNALHTATVLGIVRRTGRGREAYPYTVIYRNSGGDAKSLTKSGFSRFSTISPSLEFRKGRT